MDPLETPGATHPMQMGCGIPSNCNRNDRSHQFTTQTANSATVLFRPGHGPKATVRNHV
jgi:hypothetical protein